MFPAEHRALRELHATARELRGHWAKLARAARPTSSRRRGRKPPTSSSPNSKQRVDLSGRPTAQFAGARLAGARGISDLLLERNQALRSALLDVQHVVTLLDYLAGLAAAREDADLEAWHVGWRDRMRAVEDRGRAAVSAMAADPERAIEPADDGTLGRAGAKIGVALGTVGEAIDNRRGGWLAAAQPERVRGEMSVDVAVAVPAFLDITFVGLEGLPALGEERFAGDLVRTPGGGAITAIGCARLGLSTALTAPLGRGRGRRPDRADDRARGRPALRPPLPAHPGHRRDADRPGARDGHLRPRRARPRGRRRCAGPARRDRRPQPARRRARQLTRVRERRRRRRPRLRRTAPERDLEGPWPVHRAT